MELSLFSIQSAGKGLNPDEEGVLADSHHHFASLKKLSVLYKALEWKTNGLQISILTIQNGEVISHRLILFYGRSCNNHSALALFEVFCLEMLMNIPEFPRTFKIDYGVSFLKALNSDVAKYM